MAQGCVLRASTEPSTGDVRDTNMSLDPQHSPQCGRKSDVVSRAGDRATLPTQGQLQRADHCMCQVLGVGEA